MNILFFLFSLLLFFSFSLPNHYFPWLNAIHDFFAISSCLTLSMIALRLNIYAKRIHLFFLLIILLIFIQFYFNLIYYLSDLIILSIYLTSLTIVIISTYSITIENEYYFKIVLVAIIFTGLTSAFISICQWLQIYKSIWILDLPENYRPYANLAQPNNLATLLVVSFFATLACIKKNRLLLILISSIFLFSLVLTNSRTGVISVLFGFLCILFSRKTLLSEKTNSTLLIGLFFLLYFSFPFIQELLNFSTENILIRTNVSDRLTIYKSFFASLKNMPALGYGWLQTNEAQIAGIASLTTTNLTSPSGSTHNLILDILIWSGWGFGLVILAVLTITYINIIINLRNSFDVIILCAMNAIIIHSLLELPHHYANFLVLFGILLGYLSKNCTYNTFIINKKIFFSLCASIALSLIIISIEYRKINNEIQIQRYNIRGIGDIKPNLDLDIIYLDSLNDILFLEATLIEDLQLSDNEKIKKSVYHSPYASNFVKYFDYLKLNNFKSEADKNKIIFMKLYEKNTKVTQAARLHWKAEQQEN